MDVIEQDQVDAKAVLDADALFAPVTVRTEDKGDIESDVLQQLSTLNEKAGKCGLIAIVLEPEEVPTDPDTPNPEVKERLSIQLIETQTLNNGDTGTQVSVFAAARRVRQLLHRRSFGSGVWSWVGTNTVTMDTPDKRSRVVIFERLTQETRATKEAVIIDPDEGPAPVEVTITPSAGATARYTLDGSYPGPAATAYAAPLDIATPCTLRVVAYKAGSEPSDVAQATFT